MNKKATWKGSNPTRSLWDKNDQYMFISHLLGLYRFVSSNFLLSLRIQVCPIGKVLQLKSYSEDGIGTLNPIRSGRGLDS